ncbi:MAG: hypothetical protein IKK67_02895 [Bacteroidaceae bacterium]|nr:hypothetical protein [Bacteroidaceae bacterium]
MFRKLINSKSFRPSLLLMAMAMLFMSFTAPSGTVVLKAGTAVPLSLETSIDGNQVRAGQIVQFRVVQDIKVDGKTIIAAGSLAQGQVVRAEKNGLLGSAGEVEIAVKSVQAVDGTSIYLTNGNVFDEGKNKVVLSVVVTLCCLLGFLIKGGKGEIPAGTQINASVMSNTEINVQ